MNKFNGFTLAEILLTMAIIGIVAIATITTINPKEKTVKYAYSNLYTGISEGFYNAMLDSQTTETPIFGEEEDSPENLCNALIEYINTTSESCDNITATISPDAETGESFPENSIALTTQNGMRFYFSEKQTIDMNDDDFKNFISLGGAEDKIYYYLVYADINGTRGPNSMREITHLKADGTPVVSQTADIFAFALLDSGQTVPLGLPEIDMKYMSTRLARYDINADIIYENPSRPFFISKQRAWDCYNTRRYTSESGWGDEPQENAGGDAEAREKYFNSFYSVDVPFTMSDIIRLKHPNSSFNIQIPADHGAELWESDEVDDNGLPYQCNAYDTENCFVVIDKFRY